MSMPGNIREAAFFTWESYLGTAYLWGGDDPLAGVDCSGLVLEGLKSVGIVAREFDTTAHGLLHGTFAGAVRIENGPGAESTLDRGHLVFWGADHVRHVEIVWARYGSRVLTLGASGGGSATVDRAAAVKANAYCKIRRISPGWIAAVDPFEDW